MGSMNSFVVVTKVTFLPYAFEIGQFAASTIEPIIKYILTPVDFTGPATLGALANSSFYFGNAHIPPVATDSTSGMIEAVQDALPRAGLKALTVKQRRDHTGFGLLPDLHVDFRVTQRGAPVGRSRRRRVQNGVPVGRSRRRRAA